MKAKSVTAGSIERISTTMMSLTQKDAAIGVLLLMNPFAIVAGLYAAGLLGLLLAGVFFGLSVAAGGKSVRL
ncbi:MAG: hypothetical protein ACI9YT_000657 [Halobacteriales archaeon]|jgi:hypothetical protein